MASRRCHAGLLEKPSDRCGPILARAGAEGRKNQIDRGKTERKGEARNGRADPRSISSRLPLRERDGELTGALMTRGGIFAKRTHDGARARLGQCARLEERADGARRLVGMGDEEPYGAIRLKGETARERLIRDHGKRVDIASRIRPPSARALGRNIPRRPEDEPCLTRDRLVVEHAGDAKIEQLHVAFGREEDILRLEIAVDDARIVCGVERFGYLCDQGQKLLDL